MEALSTLGRVGHPFQIISTAPIKIGCPILLPMVWGEDGPRVSHHTRGIATAAFVRTHPVAKRRRRGWGTRIFGGVGAHPADGPGLPPNLVLFVFRDP